ncbi:MAG: hypothetical protein M5U19_23395 [Microthrixaceae bacterium]|nr:hypothetical protein [Microthrixaceae bacterium]
MEILDSTGRIVAKGIVAAGHREAARCAGRHTSETRLEELVHRDDMVVLL